MIELCIQAKLAQFEIMALWSQAVGRADWAAHWQRHIQLWERMR